MIQQGPGVSAIEVTKVCAGGHVFSTPGSSADDIHRIRPNSRPSYVIVNSRLSEYHRSILLQPWQCDHDIDLVNATHLDHVPLNQSEE